ncbi:hypothetical protein [Stappia sp. MMSF_3263]|uniref:hypothetical protein n=1 Tax=Stappia sp. MMSF_3263 TaxID=3046693 RepID=UPI00273F1883|nr:hypothetical protein [Stappia sp. MMSF_3263]
MFDIIARLSLRNLLVVDAVTCVVMGALLLVAGGLLAGPLGLPADLLFYAGLLLLPVAAFMVLVALPARTSGTGAGIVVAGNWLWVAASIALPVLGLVAPSALGLVFLIVQAVAVAVLAILEQKAIAGRQPAMAG